MKTFFVLLLALLTTNLKAEIENLKIEYLDYGNTLNEHLHVYFSDGKVGVLKNEPNSNLQEGNWVAVDLDKNHTIISINPIKEPILGNEYVGSINSENNDYIATILPNLASAVSIFARMNRRWQNESQCYNRAHIWNYEEYKRTSLFSKKVFIFFTRRYIRNYNFYWWFHAIPTVLVRHEGNIVERALDPRYTRGPLPMKSWSDVFVRSKRECPIITKYSTYRNNQESEDCYLHFSSMYYWQPRDLERYENTGYENKSFIQSEVNWAYREAF